MIKKNWPTGRAPESAEQKKQLFEPRSSHGQSLSATRGGSLAC